MNILVDIIPAAARKYVLYAPYALIGLVLGAWQLADSPAWLPTALAIYAFVGTGLGLTAYSNTPARAATPPVVNVYNAANPTMTANAIARHRALDI